MRTSYSVCIPLKPYPIRATLTRAYRNSNSSSYYYYIRNRIKIERSNLNIRNIYYFVNETTLTFSPLNSIFIRNFQLASVDTI